MGGVTEGGGIHAVILGAAGYGGGELLRLLTAHPAVGQVQAVSRSHAGQPLYAAHPRLRGFLDGRFREAPDWSLLAQAEHPVLFSARANGALAADWTRLQSEWRALDGLAERLTVIDLSGDFRLGDPNEYEFAYGRPHPAPQALAGWVYGLSEHRRARLPGARRIANPGCFATAVQLALKPLLALGASDWIAINAVTGSSGSGTQPSATTHHPERATDFRAYRMLAHQHEAEIRAALAESDGQLPELSFVPHSAPMPRGIFVTVHARLEKHANLTELRECYARAYDNCPFIRLVEGSPRVHAVLGTNACDLGFAVNGRQVAVLAALDNLVKGMAGQAVQNMNLALGYPEGAGLGLGA